MSKKHNNNMTRPLAMMLAAAGFVALASGTAQAASCPTFESVGLKGMTHDGRSRMVELKYNGDWQLALNKLQITVDILNATDNSNVERYEKRLSVMRCLADNANDSVIQQATK